MTEPQPDAVRQVIAGRAGDLSGPAVIRATRLVIAAAVLLSHLIGVLIVLGLLAAAFPLPHDISTRDEVRNLVLGLAYVVLVFPFGLWTGLRESRRMEGWLREDRRPTPPERRQTMLLPLRLQAMQGGFWAVAAIVGVAVNLSTSVPFAVEVGITLTLGGLTTVTIAYLLTQRLARAVRARLLEAMPPQRADSAGVTVQVLLTWLVGTVVPLTGGIALAIASLMVDMTTHDLARAIIVLGATALIVGFGSMVLFARSVAGPLHELRDALDQLDRGDFDAHLVVNDSNELGYVQAGFNRTAAGLREREKLRDLFGRHVGQDVARRALEEGIQLGGEERFAAALFVDIIGSTTLATQRSPTQVVEALNAFFAIVVTVVGEHDGLVNKFEGDAALCIFGAPLEHPDPAGAALSAAREMQERLTRELPELPAGVGVAAGTVVAGNVGAADRFEYTVIGDPVNEAARLTELAKEYPGRVCASEAAVAAAAADGEAAAWSLGRAVTLRGRDEATRIATPRG